MTAKKSDDAKLAHAAAQVGAEHEKLSDAISSEVAEKVRLLERVVELVAPAREAISSKIDTTSSFRGLKVATHAGKSLWLLSARYQQMPYDFMTDHRVRPGIGLEWRDAQEIAGESLWKIDEIVRSIATAVESHLGKRESRTADTLERVKKLRAVADLLEGM